MGNEDQPRSLLNPLHDITSTTEEGNVAHMPQSTSRCQRGRAVQDIVNDYRRRQNPEAYPIVSSRANSNSCSRKKGETKRRKRSDSEQLDDTENGENDNDKVCRNISWKINLIVTYLMIKIFLELTFRPLCLVCLINYLWFKYDGAAKCYF